MTQHPQTASSPRTLLREFFGHSSDLGELKAPRATVGTFSTELCEHLLSLGLVEFDTRTGIAFQTASEWDVVPTAQGIAALSGSSTIE